MKTNTGLMTREKLDSPYGSASPSSGDYSENYGRETMPIADKPPDPDWIQAIVEVFSFIAGAFMTLFGMVWYASKFEGRVSNLKERVDTIEQVLYLEKGGLNVLTEGDHHEICMANKELWDKDIRYIKEALTRIEGKVDRRREEYGR